MIARHGVFDILLTFLRVRPYISGVYGRPNGS